MTYTEAMHCSSIRPLHRTLCALGTWMALAAPAGAQATPATSRILGASSGAFVALSVAGIDRSVAWYRDTLGFTVDTMGVAPNGVTRFALLSQGNALLELLQLPDAKPRTDAAPGTKNAYQIHGFFKAGFLVADIDAAHRHLRGLGVPLAYELGRPPNGPYRSFGVRDPEGNLLQFFGR